MKQLDFHDMIIPISIQFNWRFDKNISVEVIYNFNGEKPVALYGFFGNINTETFYQIGQQIKNEK